MRGAPTAAIVTVIALAAGARAEPAIVIVETRATPALPALVSQVELHVAGRAVVKRVAATDADPLTFAERASALVAAGDATIVVWIAPVDHGFLVFAAGRWPGRALIELVHVDDTMAPAEIERTIALKIAGLLDTLLVAVPEPGAAIGVPPQIASRSRAWRIELAGLVAYEPHQRAADGRTALTISHEWQRAGLTVAPGLTAYWQPSGTIDGDTGRATVTELGGAAGVAVGRVLGSFEVSARPRVVLAALLGKGESTDGRRGSATVIAPYVGFELGARYALSPTAGVGVIAGCDLAMIHHELEIDQATIVDLGRARFHVGLALTVAL